MTQPTTFPPGSQPLRRRGLLAAAASSAFVLLAACSGPGESAGSPTAAASAPATAPAGATPPSTAATPTAETAKKTLVAGFPGGVLPLMDGAEIQSSSLEKGEPVSVASVTATVTATPADVLAFYTKAFTDQGFTAQPGDSVDGVPLKTFIRAGGQEIVTVSVVRTSATATFTLGATLFPASFK